MKFYLTSVFANVADYFVEVFQLTPAAIKVAFVANASDPYADHPWTDMDRDKLVSLGFQVEDLDLRTTQGLALKEKLSSVNVVFVAGGNTAYLFKLAQDSGLIEIIKELSGAEIIYVGSSAGSILAGPSAEPFYESDKQELAEMGQNIELNDYKGAGLVDFVLLPHYNKQKYKEEFENIIIPKFKDRYEFLTLTDDQAINIRGSNMIILP
jgi:dipeptidase E